MDGSGHQLRESRPAHDSVLHLLLDVRLPAYRRSCLRGRRHAGTRIPVGRYVRAHHAEWRRLATRRRPLALARGHHSQLHLLRPNVQLRTRGDFARRLEAHVREDGTRLLLHHGDERELHASGHAERRGSEYSQGYVLVPRRAGREKAARAIDGFRHHLP